MFSTVARARSSARPATAEDAGQGRRADVLWAGPPIVACGAGGVEPHLVAVAPAADGGETMTRSPSSSPSSSSRLPAANGSTVAGRRRTTARPVGGRLGHEHEPAAAVLAARVRGHHEAVRRIAVPEHHVHRRRHPPPDVGHIQTEADGDGERRPRRGLGLPGPPSKPTSRTSCASAQRLTLDLDTVLAEVVESARGLKLNRRRYERRRRIITLLFALVYGPASTSVNCSVHNSRLDIAGRIRLPVDVSVRSCRYRGPTTGRSTREPARPRRARTS